MLSCSAVILNSHNLQAAWRGRRSRWSSRSQMLVHDLSFQRSVWEGWTMKALAPLLHKLLRCVKFCMNRVDFGGQGWWHRKGRKSRASRAASDAKRGFVQVQAMKAAVPKWAMPVRAMPGSSAMSRLLILQGVPLSTPKP